MDSDQIKNFYDEFSDEYDSMTNFDERFDRERLNYENIVRLFNLKKILDAGCGTGFHSILLAQLGCDVTSVDVSSKMLKKLEENAMKYSIKLKSVNSDFQHLLKNVESGFEAVFCLGNSLPHLLDKNNLDIALKNFYFILKPEGRLFIQILNYERILAEKKELQNIRQVGDKTFTRSYRFIDNLIEFNIRISGKNVQPRTISIRLLPVRWKMLQEGLTKAGFSKCEQFGGVSLEKYEPLKSNDLFVIATK